MSLIMLVMPVQLFAVEKVTLTFTVNDFEVTGENPLSQSTTREILAPYKGAHTGLDRLIDAGKALESGMADRGFSFHRVVLPQQTLEAGIVRLEVIAFKVGQVEITGNKYFSEQNILKSIPAIKPGQIPNTEKFSRALDVANYHPAKEYDLKIKQGIEPDTIDAEVKIKDSKPWMIFAGVNNIGSDETGEFRTTIAGQYSNFLDADNILSISYTTSPGHYGDVKQYGLNYQIPLYQFYSQLNFFYTSSDVDTGQVGDFDISGAGRFLGASLTHFLPGIEKYEHQVRVGIQDHLFTNESLFFGLNLGTDVRSRPVNLDYLGEYKADKHTTHFFISALFNLTSGSNNSKRAYRAVRFDADHQWQVIRFGASTNYFLPKQWLLRGRLSGQWSDDILIPGEQFGLGGYASVRGFEERAVSADSGLTGSIELWAPPVRQLNNLRLLAFLDGGYRHVNEITLPGEENNDTIFSIGVGMRWQWKDAFNFSLDYGYVLDEARQVSTTADEGNARFHVNMAYRF